MGTWRLTAAQRRALEGELAQTRDAALFRRILALLEVDAGCPVGQVAQRLRVDRRSVQRWIARYRRHATVEALRHQPGPGASPALGPSPGGPLRAGGPPTLATSARVGRCPCLRTGHAPFLAQPHKRAKNFQAFLKLIHRPYRAWSVALLLDENSGHTAQGSLRLAEALGIQLLWLPKRSPPLNPVEHLRRDAKAILCANYQHACLDHQVGGFIDYLQSLSAPPSASEKRVCSPKSFGSDACGIDFDDSLSNRRWQHRKA
jgi:transposase